MSDLVGNQTYWFSHAQAHIYTAALSSECLYGRLKCSESVILVVRYCHFLSFFPFCTSYPPTVVSGVPQGTILDPLLFSLYINRISLDIESEIRLFADDCVCYREIKNGEDTLKLQRYIDRLGSWARKWGMRFQPVKCNMMQLNGLRSGKGSKSCGKACDWKLCF